MNFTEYQEQARKTVVYANVEGISLLSYVAMGLAGEAGETVNKIKKIYRDDGGVITEVRLIEIAKEAGGTLWYLAQICSELGLSLDDVAQANLELLADRHARSVINGDGDNR